MIVDPNTRTEHHEIFQDGATGYSDLRDQDAMAANRHVVPDLHQVIDLGTLADHGVADGAAVDHGPCADLDIVLNDDAAELRHFLMAPRTHHIAEAVLPDVAARVNDHPVADEGMDKRGAGPDEAITPDAHGRSDHRIGRNYRAGADLGIGTDDRARVDRHAGLAARRRMHAGARRNIGRSEHR